MLCEQQDVVDTLSMRHGLMHKTIIPLNPQIEYSKLEIWQLVSSITIWYIWKTKYLKVFQDVIKRYYQIKLRFGWRLWIISKVL